MDLSVINEAAPAEGGGCSSGSCGTTDDQMSHLSEDIKQKVFNHPCYSEDAHHYFARMHVAVAPACNIQCHYCNRKYDCSNESRPGVVSELLSPEEAVMKTKAVAATIPQMTVLGIAGPGDPLANPERTFATFRMLSEQAPDIKLCVSTNGLALPEAVEELSKHNIDHVTITINTVDPEIGAKIYPWIYWNNRRIHGVKGAKILIEQQQKGLQMLTDRGILVKVNSVMIPGVNDEHLKEVSRIVKSKGAFLHNVMPLIAEAEHGTFYGVMGQRGPTPEELQDLQDSCAGDMNMMRHCRQCRADAVGLLGEDRGEEFTLDKIAEMNIDYDKAMKVRAAVHQGIEEELAEKQAKKARLASATVAKPADDKVYRPVLMAVATSGQGVINQHFGHATEFLIYEASSKGVRFISHRKVDQYCIGNSECGEKESALEGSIRALQGCEVVLCSKIGFEPWGMLEDAGIAPNGEHAMETIDDAIREVYQEMIDNGALEELVEEEAATA
ncbi:nitrogenase cofactor biosynthesis protein NifB [Halioxenophilus sp. WMMB6]|uniref:nitrogenase cofactor biosynthesis protein NifB n=1 Tax=Halioxenophilus sp. WMMB6 TaxID=3073815 RepID=UPI00295F3937|nr:nitrogenase cofactor biosynthesis protein NifB [Halioxenophilus sp. WMMB6]